MSVDLPPINILSLCAGIGGMELGLRLAYPGCRTVCFCEREAFPASVLAQSMEAGILDPAPIWSDLTTFDGRDWRGVVDLVAAGFPCQPSSVAGKRLGTEDERWMWPHVLRIVREVGPSFVFLENVRGLFSTGFREVLHGLADAGFAAEWGVFSAEGVGAPHRRERVFILGYAEGLRGQNGPPPGECSRRPSGVLPVPMAHPLGSGLEGWEVEHDGPQRPSPERGGGDELGLPLWPPGPLDDWRGVAPHFWPVAYPHGEGLGGLREQESGLQREPGDIPDGCDGALLSEAGRETESVLRRLADGIPDPLDPSRPHELRAYGNGVVPVCAAQAFIELARRSGRWDENTHPLWR